MNFLCALNIGFAIINLILALVLVLLGSLNAALVCASISVFCALAATVKA